MPQAASRTKHASPADCPAEKRNETSRIICVPETSSCYEIAADQTIPFLCQVSCGPGQLGIFAKRSNDNERATAEEIGQRRLHRPTRNVSVSNGDTKISSIVIITQPHLECNQADTKGILKKGFHCKNPFCSTFLRVSAFQYLCVYHHKELFHRYPGCFQRKVKPMVSRGGISGFRQSLSQRLKCRSVITPSPIQLTPLTSRFFQDMSNIKYCNISLLFS